MDKEGGRCLKGGRGGVLVAKRYIWVRRDCYKLWGCSAKREEGGGEKRLENRGKGGRGRNCTHLSVAGCFERERMQFIG